MASLHYIYISTLQKLLYCNLLLYIACRRKMGNPGYLIRKCIHFQLLLIKKMRQQRLKLNIFFFKKLRENAGMSSRESVI